MAEHDEVGLLRNLCIARQRFAADLRDERLGALGERIGAHNRLPPTTCERTGHVPGSYQAYLHELRLPGVIATRQS